MKKLHSKIIAKIIVGAIVLGGTFQVSEVVSHASSKQVSYMQLENFIKENRSSFVLPKYLGMEVTKSKNYNNFEEFKREVTKLEKGYYLVHVGRTSISFYKK